jgi:hypothetical protein
LESELPTHQGTNVSLVWMPVEAVEKSIEQLPNAASVSPSDLRYFLADACRHAMQIAGTAMARTARWRTLFGHDSDLGQSTKRNR